MIQALIARITELSEGRSIPLLVAIDGRSGVGKSTLAVAVSAQTGAIVIDGDDFYAGGTAEEWDAMTPAQRASYCIDWRRQRPVLEAVAQGEPASFFPYDWRTDDGSLSDESITCRPAPVVILEGAYSGRPELADLFHLRVLVDTSDRRRRDQLLRREGDRYRAEWEARWASAEEYCFGTVVSPETFDLVLSPLD